MNVTKITIWYGALAAGNQPSGSSGGSPVASPSNTPADASPPEGSVTPDTPTVSSIPSAGTYPYPISF